MLASLLLLLLVCPSPEPQQRPGLPITGVVIDADARPVAGAEVALVSRDALKSVEMQLIDRGTTDDAGSFRLELDAVWLTRSDYRQAQVVAFHDAHGFAGRFRELHELRPGQPIELRLEGAELGSLRFLDEAGEPVAGLAVVPAGLPSNPAQPPPAGSFPRSHRLPQELARDWARATDGEGRVALPMELEELRSLWLESPERGAFELWSLSYSAAPPDPFPDTVALPPFVERTFELTGLPPGPRVQMRSYHAVDERAPSLGLRLLGDLPVELDGRLRLRAPGGFLALRATSAADATPLPYYQVLEGAGIEDVAVLEPTEFETSFRLEGRIVDSEKRPVAGLRLHPNSSGISALTTDAEGRFALESPAEVLHLGHLELPPRFSHLTHPDAGAQLLGTTTENRVLLDDLVLELGWTARGIALDADGRALPEALVIARQALPPMTSIPSQPRRRRRVTLSGLTDERGRFAVDGLSPRLPVTLTVRAPGLFAELEFAEAEAAEPVEVRLSPLASARATLRTADGAPLAGLTLELKAAGRDALHQGYLGKHRPSWTLRTDEFGAVESLPVMRDDEPYVLAWPGDERYRGLELEATAAELAAGVELVLEAPVLASGRLVDAGGEPAAGAAVRLRRSEGRGTTGPDGRFALAGLQPAGEVVLAELPGGGRRFGWAVADEDTRWFGLRATPAPPGDPLERRARERELVERLARARVERGIEAGDDWEKMGGLKALAGVNPAAALLELERVAFDDLALADSVRSAIANVLVEVSPREALGVARSMNSASSRAWRLIELGAQLGPDAERELHRQLIPELRGLQPVEHRVAAYAGLADRLLDTDSDDLALELLELAQEDAEPLPRVEWPAYARAVLGETLARVDRDAGLALIRDVEDQDDVPRHLGNLAHQLAATDPEFAESLLEEVRASRSSWRASRWASRVAYRMAPVDLKRAFAIAERHDPSGYAEAMIAQALAETDPAAAGEALERAYARASEPDMPLGMLDSTPTLAALIPIAARIDPEGLDVWIARSLGYRFAEPPNNPMHAVRAAGREAVLAAFLTEFAPELAGALLQRALDEVDGDEWADSHGGNLWAAAACVDPALAVERAERAGPEAEAIVAGVLSRTPAKRLDELRDHYLHLWIIGKEDL